MSPSRHSDKRLRVLLVDIEEHHPISLGVFDYARQAGWAMLAVPRWYLSPAQLARRFDAGGLIIRVPESARFQSDSVPAVWLPVVPKPPYVPGSVVLDYRASGRLAAEHFIHAGFRQLAYCWMGSHAALNAQWKGFSQAARRASTAVQRLDWSAAVAAGGDGHWERFRTWLVEQVAALPKPLGLMVDSDWTSIDAVGGLREAGIAVPEQVAVVGCFNNTVICEGADLPLSSVEMDFHAQGYQAAAMLAELLAGRRPPRRPLVIAPKGVVTRRSSDVFAVPHQGVARAMHLMRENLSDATLTVRAIAQAVGMSGMGLNYAFKRHVGVSPVDRLRDLRLRKALDLLAATDLQVQQIAAACGYNTVHRLIRCIKAATGRTPRAWRRQFADPDPD